jgi:hypothetical protein
LLPQALAKLKLLGVGHAETFPFSFSAQTRRCVWAKCSRRGILGIILSRYPLDFSLKMFYCLWQLQANAPQIWALDSAMRRSLATAMRKPR